MAHIENSIQSKKEILKNQITDIKSFSIDLNEDLQQDKAKIKKIAIAYEHSGNLLQRTNSALDRLLCQSEVRIGVYVIGVSVMIFVLLWKFRI
jgi:hypothetical protein